MIPNKFTERGQALVVIALSALVLFGFVALAIDGSAKFADRRHAQNAADAAALAGALALVNEETTACGALQEWECKALLRAEDNGYDDFTNNEVWVFRCDDPDRLDPNVPPVDPPLNCGPYEGNENYIEVIILSDVNTTFARVFGWDQFHNLVQAVTLAKPGKNLAEGAMIISYDPDPNCSVSGTGGYSVSVSGNSTVNLHGGGIFMNSDEVCGFTIPNCADLNITGGAGINTVGANNVNTTGCTFDPPLSNNYNQNPIVIPDDVYWPDVPPACSTAASAYNDPPGSNTWHITPGHYTDFPQSTINGDIVGNKKDIVMDPGVYCVDGDIHWSGNTFDSLDGSSGVTLYVTSGHNFSLSINSPIVLTASTSGDYQGYLIIQEGTHTNIEDCTINGGAYLDINGLIYAPYCDFTINGNGGETAVINAQVVGWDIKINGTNAINFNYSPSNLVKIKRRVGLIK